MDPDATLKQLRALVRDVQDQEEEEFPDLTEQAEEFAELFEALDDWLKGGGFKPRAWR